MIRRIRTAALLAAILAAPATVRAHFLWLTAEPGESAGSVTLRAMFNEPPLPDAEFRKYVENVAVTVDGQVVPSRLTDEAREARWAGKAPTTADAGRDLGVSTRGGKTFRLVYTARAQTAPVAASAKEAGTGLRVRLIEADGGPKVEVLFDGKAVPKARIRVYPEEGEPTETAADDDGRAPVAGPVALWATWVDPTPGEAGGKAYPETRHYATFTYRPIAETPADAHAFATVPAPAVNSFGGAVLGDWLYVYGGHVGRTHQYSVETTAKHFRRLNLKDRATWEELPMGPDLQGLALVTDGRYLYRIGGMSARNAAGDEPDLHSVADFARFDPGSKAWTDLAPLPRPRSTHDAVVDGRTIYVFGGWTMAGATDESTFLEDGLAFDLDKPEAGWRPIPQPFRRRALSVGVQGGKVYVLGGLVGGAMKVDRRVDVYDPAAGAWSRGPDLPAGGRVDGFGTSAWPVGGRLHVSGASGRLFRLSAAGDAWEAVGAWARPRITHRLLPGPGGSLLAVGGTVRGDSTPSIESLTLTPTPATESPAVGD